MKGCNVKWTNRAVCPGRVCSFDAHADGRSDYRHQTAGFHLIFDFRAGLWTGSSDLSGERTGSHPVPEQLSVGDGDLASYSLIIGKKILHTVAGAALTERAIWIQKPVSSENYIKQTLIAYIWNNWRNYESKSLYLQKTTLNKRL